MQPEPPIKLEYEPPKRELRRDPMPRWLEITQIVLILAVVAPVAIVALGSLLIMLVIAIMD